MNDKKFESDYSNIGFKDFVHTLDKNDDNVFDLSFSQDLSIAVMNLISIEEHLVFSGSKSGNKIYFDGFLVRIRKLRKKLLLRLLKNKEAENWCIVKHLLAASMRLMECGSRMLDAGMHTDAYEFFSQSYDLYCYFYGLNYGGGTSENIGEVEKILETAGACLDEEEFESKLLDVNDAAENLLGKKFEESTKSNLSSLTKKLRDFVKKSVNCCIE